MTPDRDLKHLQDILYIQKVSLKDPFLEAFASWKNILSKKLFLKPYFKFNQE